MMSYFYFADFALLSLLIAFSIAKTFNYNENQSTSCNLEIRSTKSKNGTVESPKYPEVYPSYISCSFTFQGFGKERVQIKFLDMDLYYPHIDRDDPKDCENVDAVLGTVFYSGAPLELPRFCGARKPPQIMSIGNRMVLTFESMSTAVNVRGFKAEYRFLTDFGITTGVQDDNQVCGFVYRSSSRKSGTFTSPNYPGYYPRNTECNYLFYGNDGEVVHIGFPKFKVEGLGPNCAEEVDSDYVEFSNFNDDDPKGKMPRYCDTRNGKMDSVTSKSKFFRVKFKSNEKYDQTGFLATYEFRRKGSSGRDNENVNELRDGANSAISVNFSFIIISISVTLSIVSLTTSNLILIRS